MNNSTEAPIRIKVDPTNPGQFFACCGLLELADRLWSGAEGWFEAGAFAVRATTGPGADAPSLRGLLGAVASTSLQQVDPEDDCSSPIQLAAPFELLLDWWLDDRAGGARLKVWAGSMRGVRIARAMQGALRGPNIKPEALFDQGVLVYDPDDQKKKVEPFYFDSRRGSNARAVDIGFSPDSLQMTSIAHPAVEFFCLVGLQRCRPMPTEQPRVFDYHTWDAPLDAHLAPLAVCGLLQVEGRRGFRFENSFRTDQRKHKAFTTATAALQRR